MNTFSSETALETHLAVAHFHCLPYHCEPCGSEVRFPSRALLLEHYHRDHTAVHRVSWESFKM